MALIIAAWADGELRGDLRRDKVVGRVPGTPPSVRRFQPFGSMVRPPELYSQREFLPTTNILWARRAHAHPGLRALWAMPAPRTKAQRHPLQTGRAPRLDRSWLCVGGSRPWPRPARRAPPSGRQRGQLDRDTDQERARQLPESCTSAGGTFAGGVLAGMGGPLWQLDDPCRRHAGRRQDQRSGRAGGRRAVPLPGWISSSDRWRCRGERAKRHNPVRLGRGLPVRQRRQRTSLRSACRR